MTKNTITRIFLRYQDTLVRALLKLSVKSTDVDDILQEALARALETSKRKNIEFPKSYLYTISRNMAFREQERRAREVQSEIDHAILDANIPAADEELYYRQMLQVFWEAMDTLPKAQRRAILMRRIYGLSHKEIAAKMGVSISSVEKYFAQGIRRCQDVMRSKGFSVEEMMGRSTKTNNDRAGAGDGGRAERGRSYD